MVLRLDSENDSPTQIRPNEAGRSHAGRTNSGWITAPQTQVPNVRLDQIGSLFSTS